MTCLFQKVQRPQVLNQQPSLQLALRQPGLHP